MAAKKKKEKNKKTVKKRQARMSVSISDRAKKISSEKRIKEPERVYEEINKPITQQIEPQSSTDEQTSQEIKSQEVIESAIPTKKTISYKGRVPTGISGLDNMVGGGFENQSINLVAGGGGSGKSIFGLQFLIDGLKRGESVLYITFEEKKEDFYINMKGMGYDLQKAENTGKFIFIEYSPEKVKMMLDEGGGAIESTVLKNNIKRMVVDSISSFSLLFEDESARRQAVLGLFGMIRKWNVTSLFTVQYNPSDKEDEGLSYLEFEADSIILLYYLSSKGTRQRFIEVLKMRGTDHSKDVHVFNISRGGIRIGAKATLR